MKSNIGTTDGRVRVAIGTVLAVFGIAVLAGVSNLGPVVGGVAILAGGILLGTAVSGFCPLYRLVGDDTSR